MAEPNIFDYVEDPHGPSCFENIRVGIEQLSSYQVHKMLGKDISKDEAAFGRVTDFLNWLVESRLKEMVHRLNAVLEDYGCDEIRIDDKTKPCDDGYFAVHSQKCLEIIKQKAREHIIGVAKASGVRERFAQVSGLGGNSHPDERGTSRTG